MLLDADMSIDLPLDGEIGLFQETKGDKGDTGNGIASASIDDGYLTLHYTDGTDSDPFYVEGPQGETGPQGAAFTYADFTPEQLESLTGPRGLTGPAGPQGIQGIQGERGERGLQGIQGERGLTGDTGATGPQGIQGPAGEHGVDGKSAYEIAVAQGFVGDENAWLASLVGPQGQTGAAGTNGSNGKSAYEVAVDEGFVGNEAAWLASLVGPTGATGATGAKGETGATGQTGATGADGKSAYQVAVDNGFVGTEAQWLQSLVTSVYNMLQSAENGSY